MFKKTKRGLSLLLVCLILLTLLPTAAFATEAAPTTGPIETFTIVNPYAEVDWATFGQYRAALHTHTCRSDGAATFREAVLDHYNKGFDILAITDHDALHTGGWADGGQNALTPQEEAQILTGTFDGPFPGSFGPELRRPTDQGGMIWVPTSNEQSRSRHINSFWADVDFAGQGGMSQAQVLQAVEDAGGLAILNHPGRYTGGVQGGAWGVAVSRRADTVAYFVELLDRFPSNLGFELFNRLDHDTRSDRVLWDAVLTELMPYGRFVWGFSNDDSHTKDETGYNFNVMLMPELTADATRESMETGAFYMVSRVIRSNIAAGGTDPAINVTLPDGGVIPSGGDASTLYMLDQPTPGIDDIVVDGNTITITGRDYDRIEWIADGAIIYTGEALDVYALQAEIGSYVRAQLISATGIAMTQPFGILPEGEDFLARPANDLYEIPEIPARRVRNGAEPTTAGLRLPATVTVATARGWHAEAPVTWNLTGIVYDPAVTDVEQTFTVPGTITLPAGVTNGLNRGLTVQVEVTVREYETIVITPIAEAHDMEGEPVIVRGYVTGFYDFNQGHDNAFFLRDGGGAQDAILIRITGLAPTPGARSFVGEYVEVEGVRQLGAGSGFAAINLIYVTDPLMDITVIDTIAEIPTEPTPVELIDLLNANYRSQFVSLERVFVIPARTGPPMPLSNMLLGDPATGLPLVFDPATGEIIPPTANPGSNLGGTSFTINFSGDYEGAEPSIDRPFFNLEEPRWITIPAANIHWWEGRHEVQIRLTDTIESWDEITVDPPIDDFPFTDVGNHWAREYIQFVYENDIMRGTSDTTFEPSATLTRAMVATILYRLAGEPETEFRTVFDDVAEGFWFSDAIVWAYDNDVVAGIGDDLFAPWNPITREQFATMLYRFAEAQAPADFTLDFPDADQVNVWAEDAMAWAVANDLIRGTGEGTLNPAGTAYRAQAAAILARFMAMT